MSVLGLRGLAHLVWCGFPAGRSRRPLVVLSRGADFLLQYPLKLVRPLSRVSMAPAGTETRDRDLLTQLPAVPWCVSLELAPGLSRSARRNLLQRTAGTLKACGAMARGSVNLEEVRLPAWGSSTDRLRQFSAEVFLKWVSWSADLTEAPLPSEALRLLRPTSQYYSGEAGNIQSWINC